MKKAIVFFALTQTKEIAMRTLKYLTIVFFLFSLITCDSGNINSGSKVQIFDWKLQGKWETHESDSRYTGTLEIDYSRITITGYGESQTPKIGGNDAERPFKNITKNTALSGYSEDGKIFIKDAGTVQEGIPYNYYPSDDYFTGDEFLRFNFGGRDQTLRKIK